MINGECPFFRSNEGRYLSCEIGKFKFPDMTARDQVVINHCAGDYKQCMFYKILNDYYERKYENN